MMQRSSGRSWAASAMSTSPSREARVSRRRRASQPRTARLSCHCSGAEGRVKVCSTFRLPRSKNPSGSTRTIGPCSARLMLLWRHQPLQPRALWRPTVMCHWNRSQRRRRCSRPRLPTGAAVALQFRLRRRRRLQCLRSGRRRSRGCWDSRRSGLATEINNLADRASVRALHRWPEGCRTRPAKNSRRTRPTTALQRWRPRRQSSCAR
mmetsp:Transcript_81222/g.206308  ORF Transcript_81222/g.206308 Transcript_81222/m.206308 type:complete len:208 (-) Transcript_81222:154-777(-)